jgi:hypothetical protein
VGSAGCRLLCDSGAAVSVISGDTYRRLRKGACVIKGTTRHNILLSADSSSMPVSFDVEVDVKIAGMKIPCTFSVVENLGFEAILGLDFLRDARAVIDLPNNMHSLYDGLIAVPLIRADDDITVYTIDHITIPLKSEASFNASTQTRLRPESYMVEVSPFARCPQLLVARTVFNARRRIFCCNVLNPTERAIELPQRTPVARVAPIDIFQNKDEMTQKEEERNLTVAEMRVVLEQKQVSFKEH